MRMTIYLIIFLLSLLILRRYFRNKRTYDLINQIPGPPGLPLIGNLLMFNVSVEDLWNVLRNINKEYPIAKFWLGSRPVISVHHPDDAEVLLSSPRYIEKGHGYKFFYDWFKTGLLTSSGQKWQHRRKILTPAFHFKILKKYMDITNENGKKIVEALKAEKAETVKSLLPFCANYTLNIICESAMGISLNKIDVNISKEYKNAVSEIGNLMIYRMMRPYLQNWMNPFIRVGRLQTKVFNTLHKFTNKVINERKEYHNRTNNKYLNNLDRESDEMNGSKKKLAMLDLLLAAEKDGLIEHVGIQEEVDTFMFAGHDTTGMALVYTIMLLAEHKEFQEKARFEVSHVLNNSNGEIGIEELQKFNYLERCIKESLRLFPPVSVFSRCAAEDIKMRDYVIPAGTEIGCHIFDIHRDPVFWDEPTKFDPDRFLKERIQGRHPYSYIPFSAGPRNCIGQKFALLELKSLLAHILYNFELEPVSRTKDMKLILDLVTRPSKPVYTRFVRIDNNNEDHRNENLEGVVK